MSPSTASPGAKSLLEQEQFGRDLRSRDLSQEDTGSRMDFSASEVSKAQTTVHTCVSLSPEMAPFSLSSGQTL